jgi:hypothetical protein
LRKQFFVLIKRKKKNWNQYKNNANKKNPILLETMFLSIKRKTKEKKKTREKKRGKKKHIVLQGKNSNGAWKSLLFD